MSHSDDPIVKRLRLGDTEALAEFLEGQRSGLLAYIERRLGTALRRKVDPQDVLQEVSVCALQSLADVDFSRRDPFGWLCQLAELRIIDAHRRFFGSQKRAADREVPLDEPGNQADRRGLIDLLVVTMTTPSQAFSRNQRELRLHEALGTLPEENRDALMLRYLDGLPTKEIAQRLGKSDGAVRVMLSRSLNRLQSLLGSDAAP